MADTYSRRISPNTAELEELLLEVSAFLAGKASRNADYAAAIALEEMITNTIKYGYDNPAGHKIDVGIRINGPVIALEIVDDAREFDPLKAAEPDVSKPLPERNVGGLGIFLVRRLVQSIAYRRLGGKNHVAVQVKNTDDPRWK